MDFYLGFITPWSGILVPSNWMLCQGQILQKRDYPQLFEVLGARYGGDNITTFALPDLQQRVITGAKDKDDLGKKQGNETTTLTVDNLAEHHHFVKILSTFTSAKASSDPKGNYLSCTSSTDKDFGFGGTLTRMGVKTVSSSGIEKPAAFSVVQPVLSLNFIIQVKGGIKPMPPKETV